jgi:hypothetical protein
MMVQRLRKRIAEAGAAAVERETVCPQPLSDRAGLALAPVKDHQNFPARRPLSGPTLRPGHGVIVKKS